MTLPREVTVKTSSGWGPPTSYPLQLAWLHRLGRERRFLIRTSEADTCTDGTWCRASAWAGDGLSTLASSDLEGDATGVWPRVGEARWPTACETCHRPFRSEEPWRYDRRRLYSYKGPYGHLLVTLRNAPPGSIYDAQWLHGFSWGEGPDGRALHAICPNGYPWHLDGEASNCTRPQQVPVPGIPNTFRFVRTHYCWVRHGDPRRPATLHVDKQGETCAAGAGSILAGSYHGFLHHGGFTQG